MINALQSIQNFDRNRLHACVRQRAPLFDLSFTFFFFSVSCFSSKFWSLECFHFLRILDACNMVGQWCYSWGAAKLFCFHQCWSCASTNSVTRYNMANHCFCSGVVWLRPLNRKIQNLYGLWKKIQNFDRTGRQFAKNYLLKEPEVYINYK